MSQLPINRRRIIRLMAFILSVFVMIGSRPVVAPARSVRISVGHSSTLADHAYVNPLKIKIANDGLVESCADPAIIRAQQPGDNYWYMYCSSDPLSGGDRNSEGGFNYHLIPTLRSLDLINWVYAGDVFGERPAWAAGNAGLWAPDIQYFDGVYHLYYTATDTNLPGGGSAIGVAVSTSPVGPWADAGAPVVEPHAADCCPGSRRAVIDPYVLTARDGQRYIYYGSFFGGISARHLSPDGLRSDPASQTLITIPNRYEAPYVVRHDNFYYLFVSATNCCNGPLTGYSVFAGRSTNPLGPFVDREGVSLLDGRVGGTIVISMNGNRWVGPGHNAVLTDFDGQDWLLYHAIDRDDPYFSGAPGFTKRPPLLDPLDWVGGWPTVRGGRWASSQSQPAPAAQPGEEDRYQINRLKLQVPGALVRSLTDEFNGVGLGRQWHWVRAPAPNTYRVGDGAFSFDSEAADLFVDSNDASVLTEPAPIGDYIVETKVKLNLPPEGCCFNYVQAGLVIYGDDDNYLKLAHASIWETRQTEYAKELSPVPDSYPRYGSTVVGPPGDWTYLRIAKQTAHGEERYTAYTSRDGVNWTRGGVWTHALGSNARIGLISMGGTGFTAQFDYVRGYRLKTLVAACAAEDVTTRVDVKRGGFRFDHRSGRFKQSITLQNSSGAPIQGPISLVLDNLSGGAKPFGADGQTACASQQSSPLVEVDLGAHTVLNPGERVTVILQFDNPTREGITYSARVLSGGGR